MPKYTNDVALGISNGSAGVPTLSMGPFLVGWTCACNHRLAVDPLRLRITLDLSGLMRIPTERKSAKVLRRQTQQNSMSRRLVTSQLRWESSAKSVTQRSAQVCEVCCANVS